MDVLQYLEEMNDYKLLQEHTADARTHRTQISREQIQFNRVSSLATSLPLEKPGFLIDAPFQGLNEVMFSSVTNTGKEVVFSFSRSLFLSHIFFLAVLRICYL